MSLIIAENVGHAYGDHEVFRDVSFRVAESDRIGLVGPNGEGKTTLLRVIAGLLESTAGDVHRRRGLRIGYLPQDPPPLEGTTVHQTMLDVFADLRRMERELHDIAGRMEGDAGLLKRYGEIQAEMEALGGYDYSTRIEQVLTGLAFEREMWDRPLSQLSGGQRTRAYLGTLLLREPDVLLLDEPTNHLDLDSTEWLEHWLGSFRGALIVVSHDRYLLDRVTTKTWEVAFRRLEPYRGAYSKYLVLRQARFSERMKAWEAQQAYIRQTEEFIRIHIAGQRTREAQGRRKRLERFLRDDAIERPQTHRAISLDIPACRRTGDMVLLGTHLEVGYDPAVPLLRIDELELVRGQRVAVVGANGAGKTTLLRTLLGELELLSGTLRHGANVQIGYLSQTHANLDPQSAALDVVRAASGERTSKRARSVLGRLLLSGDDVFKRINELSGGQRSRVALARLVALGANVLMLDEPTNHLDIPSTEVVQDALKRFDGTTIFVSHDRYLIEALATHVWAIDGQQFHCITGNWQAYLQWRSERRGAAGLPGDDETGRSKRERKAQYRQDRKRANERRRLRRRLDELEAEIEAIEEDLAKLNQGISDAADAGQVETLRELSKEHQQKSARLKMLWDEWEQVGEKLE